MGGRDVHMWRPEVCDVLLDPELGLLLVTL